MQDLNRIMHFYQTYFFLITFLLGFQASGQKNNKPHFEIREYGLHRSETYENAKRIVGDRWNIHFRSVAQCLISKELKDSTDAFNRHSDSLIAMEYGKKWLQKFEKEIEEEKKLIERFIYQVKHQGCISHLDSILALENNTVQYLIFPYSKSEKRYEVLVYGWGIIDSKTDLVCYYKFKLHKNRKKIMLLTDKPSFLFKQDS